MLLAALVLVAGCSSATRMRLDSGSAASSPAPGTSASGARVAIDVRGGSAIGAVAAAAALAIIMNREQTVSEDRPAAMFQGTPPMDERRSVNVQDCTRPIEHPGANLKCR